MAEPTTPTALLARETDNSVIFTSLKYKVIALKEWTAEKKKDSSQKKVVF